MKGSTADDANSAFYIANGTNSAGEFRPGFIGIKSGDANPPLTFYGRTHPTYDTGTKAFVRFIAQTWTGDDLNGTSGAPSVRPMFQFIGGGAIGAVMTIMPDGNVGIGTAAPATTLDVNGDANVEEDLTVGGDLITTTKTPASASATGTAGTIAYDADYIYVCTATDTWKRIAIATW
jgi:hypothetical protein